MTDKEYKFIGRAVPIRAGELPSNISECHLEILRLREELLGAHAELSELRHRITLSVDLDNPISGYASVGLVNHLEAQVQSLQAEIKLIRSSWTWRLGKVCLLPLRILQRILGRKL